MDRNRLLYFLVGGGLVAFGYVVRVMQVENYARSSTILIVMGLFYIFALMFRKANEGVLIVIELAVCCGLHIIRFTNMAWYNHIYDSRLGEIVLGGPFHYTVLIHILFGVVLGVLSEMIVRQYNRIGLGD